ncbi:MAG TPA: riboflavin synthase [Saprospiraceae bacterium]|nr:riboflavin synthase [Saprospiraceae bacterium]
MFTGIIETLGRVISIQKEKGNLQLEIASSLSKELKIDQSLSHNGICLTVIQHSKTKHKVTAVRETLEKTNLLKLKKGDFINLERAMLLSNRLDGHLVTGHVDGTSKLKKINRLDGSHVLEFELKKEFAPLIIPKGSVCINGISLTVSKLKQKSFQVTIIPYTWDQTNLKYLKAGDFVNIEFDLIGKYIIRSKQL